MYRSNHRKGGTSAVSLIPKFTFVLIVQTCTWGRGQMSQGWRSFLTGHPHLPRALTHAHTQTLSSGIQDRLCGPAHRVLHSSALCPDEGVSYKAQTGEVDPGVQRRRLCVCFSLFFSLLFPGCKTIIDTYHRAT